MKEKLLRDLPIYLNGYGVTMLLLSIPKIGPLDIAMFLLAMVTFLWYGKAKSQK